MSPANLRPTSMRTAMWAMLAIPRVRRQLRAGGLDAVRLPAPPSVSGSAAERALAGVLRRREASCLESAVVRQAWRAGHGDPRDVVIGVRPPREGFKAHAWLAGDPEDAVDAAGVHSFTELMRQPWIRR